MRPCPPAGFHGLFWFIQRLPVDMPQVGCLRGRGPRPRLQAGPQDRRAGPHLPSFCRGLEGPESRHRQCLPPSFRGAGSCPPGPWAGAGHAGERNCQQAGAWGRWPRGASAVRRGSLQAQGLCTDGRSDSPFGCRPPRGRVEAQALPSSLRICARPSEGPGGGAGRRRDRRLGLGSQPRHERCPQCRLPLHAGDVAGGWGRARSAQRQTGWPCLPESHFPSASWRWAAAAPLAGREVTHGRHAVTPVSRRQP